MLKKELILIFLRGLLMGIADTIPGVSGGTIAFITGIYSRLVHSISTIDFSFLKLIFKGNPQQAYQVFRKIDFALFIPLLLGIVTAIIVFSKVISFTLLNYPAPTFALFFGLILASAVLIYRRVDGLSLGRVVILIVGVVTAYLISNTSAANIDHSLPLIFLAGAIAICAMILPGISGAFILLLINQYEFLLDSLQSWNFPVILSFIAGAILGLLAFSKLLDYLIKNFKSLTFTFLIGIMLGSLGIPAKAILNNGGINLRVIILALLGFFIVFILERNFKE